MTTQTTNQSKRLFTFIALGTILTMGLWDATRGVILPHLLTDLRVGPTLGSQILVASAVGYLVNSLSFGTYSRRLGLRKVAGLGVAVVLVFLTLFLTLKLPLLLIPAGMVMGAGLGMIEMTTSLPISLLYGDQQSGILNLLHGCFGMGAFLGSMYAAGLMSAGFGWRVPLALIGGLLVTWGLVYRRLPELSLATPHSGAKGFGPVLRDPYVWAATLAVFFACVGEAGAVIWLPTYMQKVKGLSDAASALTLSFFFAGFTGMRLAGGWVVRRLGEVRSVVGLAAVGAVGLFLLMRQPGSWFWLAALAGMGVAVGFATCTSLACMRYPDRVDQIYTMIYSAGGLSVILSAPLMGWIGERVGFASTMWVPFTGYIAVMALMTFYGLGTRQRALAPTTSD